MSRSFGFCCVLLVYSVLVATLAAQPAPLTLQQKVEPSYRIEPVVQRSQARRGEVLPFSFLLTSTGRELDIELMPVKLRQEESGIIMHDDKSPAEEAVRITTPKRFQLASGKEQVIAGEITIPRTKADFYSFGILVRDQGQFPEFGNAPNGKKVSAGVRFVTQYVIRVDVEVIGKAESDPRLLEFQQGAIQAVDGRPVAVVHVRNPSDSLVEFQAKVGLVNALSEVGRKSDGAALIMPCRRTLETPDRTTIRILPGSRLRLECPIEGEMVTGDNQLRIVPNQGLREYPEQNFAVQIAPGQFPGLEAQLVRLDENILLTPGNILLGTLKGGKRSVVIKLANNSDQPRQVRLSSRDLTGAPNELLQLSQTEITLSPRKSQTVRAMLRLPPGTKGNHFGGIEIADATVDNPHAVRVPAAMLTEIPNVDSVEIAAPRYTTEPGHGRFIVAIKNPLDGYLPLHAELELQNENGERAVLTGGFGRWLDPQADTELAFDTPQPLGAGKYQVRFVLRTFEQVAPLTRTTEIELSDTQPTIGQ